jgi:hypothetical protein
MEDLKRMWESIATIKKEEINKKTEEKRISSEATS